MSQFEQDNQPDDDWVSKSQRKREVMEVTDLGKELAELSPGHRDKLPLDDELIRALKEADKIKGKHVAYKRHMQYLGKLLRKKDEQEIAELSQGLSRLKQNDHHSKALLKAIEDYREKLIQQDGNLAEQLLSEHPMLERQKLRQLIRQAKKEADTEKPAKAYKELYQYLKQAIIASN